MQDQPAFLSGFGDLLKTARKRKRLTQQHLAQRLGVHPNTISAWELGTYLPSTRGLVLELARHLSLDDQETRQLLEASLTAPTPYWLVPLPRNPFFTGREEILEALHSQLGNNQAVALTQSYALHGLGGIGKTQIALEYAYRHALEYRAVFWIEAESGERITASLLRLAEAVSLPERQAAEQPRVLAAVQRWLSTHQHWLLIWDNLDDPDLLYEFLPPMQQGAVLITTRCSALGTLAPGMDLLPMGQEEGVLFLLRRTKVLAPVATGEQMRQFAAQAPAEYTAAEKLVTSLGGLPLALDQAGAYLEETGCSFADYLQRYTQQRAHVLARRGTSGGHHPQSVMTTFRLSLERIEGEQSAADLLRVCAFLQAEAIPEEIFVECAAHLGPQLEALGTNPAQFDQAIAVLRSLSLIQRQAEDHTISLHRLVQAVLLDTMTAGEQEQWTRRVTAALDAEFPEVRSTMEYTAWMHCDRLLPHAMQVLQHMRTAEASLPLASLAYKAGKYLRERGRYLEAEPLFQRALPIRERILGSDHPEVARLLNSLAILYAHQARYAEAETLYQRALQIWEQALGPDHPDVARPLNNLAELALAQGEYAEAETLYQRALQIWEQALGPDHPHVAWTLHTLANLMRDQGKFEEAETLYQRALGIQEQHLGQQHPERAETLDDLAISQQKQGNRSEALSLAERAHAICSQSLGEAHPKTIATRMLYTQQLQERTGVEVEANSDRDTEQMRDPGAEERQAEEASLPLHEAIDPSCSENVALQEFLDACCELHPLAWCRIRDLRQTYEQWTAFTQKRVPLSRRAFAAQLRARGCRPDRTSAARIWRGVKLVNKTPWQL